MSIIYSYPTVQPTVDDLLIGTDVGEDNATKSFTVQSLVSLINAATGSGTVTSVQIATDSFLSATGGPIIDAGVITMGLAATGTPSANTFLRGDNQWVAPIVSAGITVSNQSIPLTTDVGSFNFIGQGVTVTNVGNDITVNVPLPTSDVTSILAGTGINVSSGTGNVTVSNTGVVSLISGGGLTIVEGAGGVNTLTVTGQSQGTVTSVNAGPGLKLVDGTTSTVAPQLEIQYDGSDNYINRPLTEQAPDAEDIINFQDVSSDKVRKVALSDIPITALTQVNTAISNLNNNAVEHNTDTYTSVPTATKVITLTDTEYNALTTKDASTLYLTTSTAPTTGTVQFNIDDAGITTSGTCNFTVSTTCSPAFTDGNNLTNVAIGTNYTLTSTITPTGSGCVFTGTNPQVITGTVAAGTAAVTQSLTGSIAVPPPNLATRSLNNPTNINTNNLISSGASLGNDIIVTPSGITTFSGTPGATFPSTNFGVTATIPTSPASAREKYYFGTPGTFTYTLASADYSPNPNSTYDNTSTTATFPSASTPSINTYPLNFTLDIGGIQGENVLGQDYRILITGATNQTISSPPGTNPIAAGNHPYGEQVTIQAQVQLIDTSLSSNVAQASGTITMGASGNNIALTLTGTISSTTGTVSLDPVTQNITGPAAGYNTYYYSQLLNPNGAVTAYYPGVTPPISGTSTQSVKFTATIIKTSTDYTVTSQSFTPTTATAIVAGQNTPVAGTLTGTVILSRTAFPIGPTKGSVPQACASSTNNTYYLEKGSGNTLTYAQQGDTVYTSVSGTGHPNSGIYKATIENGTTNGYISIGYNGVVNLADPCDP